jgi:CBS domain containing-hemolysin-like protein
MIEFIIPAFVTFLLILASGFFSGSETAFFSLSEPTLKAYRSSKDPRKRQISNLVMQPRDLLVTIFMFNTLVNVLIQNVVSSSSGEEASFALKVFVPLGLTLIFGEIIPKNIGMENNIKFSQFVVPIISRLHNWISPLRRWIIAITYPISRVLFFYLKKEETISKEELQHVLATSEEKGVLLAEESKLLAGYINLQTTTVKEIMWPKEDILFYQISEPLSKLVHLLVDKECSRLPVCDQDFDNLLGIITAKTFLLNKDNIQNPNDLKKFLKKPFYIPESTPAKQLFHRFEQEHEAMALVVDEYGSISGLIAQEDVVEIVIGEIEDLRKSYHPVLPKEKNETIIPAKLELSEFNALFDSNLKSENEMITIGGWLIEQIGDIPKTGTLFETEHFIFQILQADPNRIRKIYVRKLEPRIKK